MLIAYISGAIFRFITFLLLILSKIWTFFSFSFSINMFFSLPLPTSQWHVSFILFYLYLIYAVLENKKKDVCLCVYVKMWMMRKKKEKYVAVNKERKENPQIGISSILSHIYYIVRFALHTYRHILHTTYILHCAIIYNHSRQNIPPLPLTQQIWGEIRDYCLHNVT